VTVNWNGANVLQKIRGATVTALVRGTEAVREEAVTLINTGPKTGRIYKRGAVSHQASAPGQSPAADTGDLAVKIGTAVNAEALNGTIEFYSAHARPLEYGTSKMAPRPYARVAVAHKADEITKDIADEISKVLR
jgi:HK97 gp10 family phage protein